MYKQIVNPAHKYEVISLATLHNSTKAKRSNCVLNTDKLAREGIQIRPVKEAVKDCLEKYGENLNLQREN